MSSVNYNVLGLVFSSMHESFVNDLTERRTMGSIPFGGRYRLIDFPLSNFVNSGITKVGVITKANYGSLLDHIGSGRDWDLSRKRVDFTFCRHTARRAVEYTMADLTLSAISGALLSIQRNSISS